MQSEQSDFFRLNNHSGTENYLIEEIYSKEFQIPELYLDTVSKTINAYGKTNPIKEGEAKNIRLKISDIGKVLDSGPIYTVLKNGVLWHYSEYNNWIIDGDKNPKNYRKPMTGVNFQDVEKWIEKFKELYTSASDVYISPSVYDYYVKIDKEWVEVKRDVKGIPLDLEEQYPAKYSNIRMVELRDLCPDFFKARAERDTSFIDIVGYEETDSEKGSGLNPISYSAGDYYLNLYMPLGDTIKIKRHGSMGVNMQFYKIPVTQGGRNDVVFIVQEPNELYPDREFGGMYVVRPRDLNQKQYGPHESSADSYSSQYDSKKGAINTEAKFLKPMND
ncbi:hypothetical protein FGM00_09510 [Aggregatimonas sangjinii]|uniref:Uncharacterized protein n=1 Tax=Aggregatimonas sangjinii TaxID=2583587 RepID=A0A5B7SP24_9FLAO|nr:hypothetical protein [Aggregatimonas sangjinii]QCX00336.1 hypothetical protein FGM00_09510 [Aggregatimonas sangjinii]